MNTEILLSSLDGVRQVGANQWIARCPAHHDRRPSLSIREIGQGNLLVHCHAGCDQQRVITALRARGLWPERLCGQARRTRTKPFRSGTEGLDHTDSKRTEAALRIWRAAGRAPRTLVETYLQSRCININPPLALRFHCALKHPSGKAFPAMVALISCGVGRGPLGIHRTFLSPDGTAKAPAEPQRMMLGPCRGGAVQLAHFADVLMVGEGIETCLAAMQMMKKPAWAALSTSGLRALDLPVEARRIIVLADGDDPGEAAARSAARRWTREGRSVSIARPPPGLDFNDLLMGRRSPCGSPA